jgi:hypothetical protein
MMNKREIFNRVAGIISELNEQFEYLSKNADHLNDLELELFAANADFLSDHIAILLKLNAESPQVSEPIVSKPIVSEPVISKPIVPEPEPEEEQMPVVHNFTIEAQEIEAFEEEKIEIKIPEWKLEIQDDLIETFEFEDKSAEELFDRHLTEEEMRVIDEKTRLKTIPEEEFIPEVSFKPIVSQIEKPQEEVKPIENESPVKATEQEAPSLTLNEMLSAQTSQNTVSGQFNQRQVKDLKSLISLNDKLQFVRDLFNGYSLAYSEAIELINRFDNFDAADNFLKQNYAVKNNWAEKQDVADKFYEILNRRFSN